MNGLRQQVLAGVSGLVAFAAVGAGWLAATQHLTEKPIAVAQRAALVARINELVPALRYDNQPAADTLTISDPRLGYAEPRPVFRARKDGQPVAALFTAIAPDGYSGEIEMLVAVNADSRLAGVRVLRHRETPGLGDKIELAHGDWILGFSGKSLTHPDAGGWAVKKDGGVYDQFAGATITPRAVVQAVRRALEYFQEHRDALFAPPPPQPSPRLPRDDGASGGGR